MQLHNRDIAAMCFFGLKHMLSTEHGMAAARIWLVCWFRTSLLYQRELGQHGTAWLGIMLTRFGYVYPSAANCAKLCWYHAGTVSSCRQSITVLPILQVTRRINVVILSLYLHSLHTCSLYVVYHSSRHINSTLLGTSM